jgi:hypothetical protein
MEAAGVGRADAVRTLDLRDERQVLVGQFVLDEVAGYVVGDEADGQLLSEATVSAQAQRSPDVRLDGTPGDPWRHI